mmetsp:Transcript_23741/g.69948  ORF Transcript_23741/g.69948 Transcript_23741/m.69948 type:complete len:271 (-) Transcript_23741:761-1573(-)
MATRLACTSSVFWNSSAGLRTLGSSRLSLRSILIRSTAPEESTAARPTGLALAMVMSTLMASSRVCRFLGQVRRARTQRSGTPSSMRVASRGPVEMVAMARSAHSITDALAGCAVVAPMTAATTLASAAASLAPLPSRAITTAAAQPHICRCTFLPWPVMAFATHRCTSTSDAAWRRAADVPAKLRRAAQPCSWTSPEARWAFMRAATKRTVRWGSADCTRLSAACARLPTQFTASLASAALPGCASAASSRLGTQSASMARAYRAASGP